LPSSRPDYVYGDSDGVVVVPAELHDEILSRVDGR
jgi:regulator of RNase E activity RraA